MSNFQKISLPEKRPGRMISAGLFFDWAQNASVEMREKQRRGLESFNSFPGALDRI